MVPNKTLSSGLIILLAGGAIVSASSFASAASIDDKQTGAQHTSNNENFATAEPNAGVPFASLMSVDSGRGKPRPAPPPSLPLASQPISQENGRVEATLNRMNGQISDRLKGLSIGDGDLKPTKLSPSDKTLIDQLTEEEKQIKLLDARKRRLKVAIETWAEAFDPHKEQAAAGETIDAKKGMGESQSQGSDHGNADNDHDLETLKSEIASLKQSLETANKGSVGIKSQQQDPYPVVTSTNATYDGGMEANILVPYSGEMKVSTGDMVQDGVTINSISGKTVTIKDSHSGRIIPLAWGDSVPKERPAPETSENNDKASSQSTGGNRTSKKTHTQNNHAYQPSLAPPLAPPFNG
ncbi:hypothetical protein WSS15_16640 [Acetobacter pasteurianus]|uniref:Uncharacterized protein n=1 Tax=Acetobacter pasteurianus NBRC 3278 TaxID=1226660 RepID=A0A401X6T8_ACEPA|nr:hypothetical protein NBRC3278_2647 [Acetobacter pasteurianus NBRC 3278]GCD69972.1 hypothetical protein NBRC3280_2607 [Acetobacter pasteurianus NBRC 3280]GLH29014.1 hypothetical protein WSS15_16640 [Acetobacter pasteurianus]